MTRALYDCPVVPLTTAGPEVRLVVATHGAMSSSPSVGVERDGVVYELFVSTLPTPAFTASDVLDLYLHRGSFETVLADEDDEQESDRWYSHTPCGKAVCSNLGPVGVEPPPGTGADVLSRLRYARPNLLLPMSPSRFTRTSLRSWRRTWLKARQYLRQCMDLPNGPVLPLLMARLRSAFTSQPDGTLLCPGPPPPLSPRAAA
jgi:hypothetical protein